ncbi:MAG: methyltransferase domain-containing protein [Chloroflexota bacterium]|nr:methyltransferase domain-containing protein [Chloroflexota bacterium]
MSEIKQDIWAEWLLHRRHGGDAQQLQVVLDYLYPIRDKVLDHARLNDNEVLLDVGCGDGLVAFGALDKVPSSTVIFSDISADLLNHARDLAEDMHMQQRCQFIHASADNLHPIPDTSVDVVTTRSVLIYVAAKQQAFHEFFRVLRPHGRLSIFEPINRFGYPEPLHQFGGFDMTPILDIAQKVKAVYAHLQPVETDPMLDFDERDLLTWAERAGFHDIHLELQAEIITPTEQMRWENFIRTAWNPKIPTLEDVMTQALTQLEAERFANHLQPLVEANQRIVRSAIAYLWAVKQA